MILSFLVWLEIETENLVDRFFTAWFKEEERQRKSRK